MPTPFVVSVAVPVPFRPSLDYLPHPDLQRPEDYPAGTRCIVPVGNRKLTGVILGTHASPEVARHKLKPVDSLLDTSPLIKSDILALCRWISHYYHAPLGEVIFAALPPPMRTSKTAQKLIAQVSDPRWKALPSSPEQSLRGSKQKALLSLLAEEQEGLRQSDIMAAGYSLAQLKNLQEKSLVTAEPALQGHSLTTQQLRTKVPLTESQQTCYAALSALSGGFAVSLLEGVTGSGKTEVYLEWIESVLDADANAQILVLVPEIALTPQTLNRFTSRFGQSTSLYHSGLNDSERLLTWLKSERGESRIVIATRSGITLPFQNLQGIIVDEEHDSSFKQQDGARYHARDLAILRARNADCPVILGSATPSFETLHAAEQGRFHHFRLSERATSTPLPEIRLIDTRSRPLDGGISPPLLTEIRRAVKNGEQVLVFINRRGFAPVLMCPDCAWIAECSACDARLTYHRRQNFLKCHHCDTITALPESCPECQSDRIIPVGTGTERTEEFLEAQFADTPVIRIDRDSTQNKGSLERLLTPVQQGQPCILVGTQMLAKGHDFPKLTTVAILNADGGLFSSDFRSPEKTAQLMIQVAGRCGRRNHPGKVFIQSHFPDHPLLQSISRHDYRNVYATEMPLRIQGGLPPARVMAAIRGEGTDMEQVMQSLWKLRDCFPATEGCDISVHGPFPSLMQKKQHRYHGLIWVTADDRNQLRKFLRQWQHQIQPASLPGSRNFRWLLDVDPVETL